jgi:hypothetical protein
MPFFSFLAPDCLAVAGARPHFVEATRHCNMSNAPARIRSDPAFVNATDLKPDNLSTVLYSNGGQYYVSTTFAFVNRKCPDADVDFNLTTPAAVGGIPGCAAACSSSATCLIRCENNCLLRSHG